MALDLQFAYVCQKKFEELQGENEAERYCNACGLNVVNLDPLNDEARLALFERAVHSRQRLCVATTTSVENWRPCASQPIPPPIRTAGMPVLPPPELLQRERERLAQQRRDEGQGTAFSNFIAKLKFW
jgi:hypothetical protein